MMNNSPLDEHIKGKFGDYTPDVPAHIWENIIAEREKRKPAGIWFGFLNRRIALLLLAIIIIGAGITIYQHIDSSNTDKKDSPSTTSGSTEKISVNVSSADNKKTITPVNADPVIESSSDKNQNNTVAGKTNLSNGTDQSTTNNKNSLTQTPAANNKNSANQSSGTNDLSNSSNRNHFKKQKKVNAAVAMTYKTPGIISDDANTNDLEETNSNEFLLNNLLLDLNNISTERTSTGIKKINKPDLNIPCPEAEKNAAGNKRYFEIYGGPDYAFRSITDTGNSAYLQKRKESTTFSYAFSVGLRYTKVFGNGMSFRTGINYSQINEKFKFAQGNIIQTVYVTNSNGDTTGSYTTTGTRYKTTYNKFRTIDLPILIGYELGNGRFHLNLNVGAVVNLYSWQQGDVLDMSYQPVSITTGKTNSPYQFKTNVGIGFMGSASVYYKLTERLHILAEPYYRYNFSSASKSDLTLKQKYNTLGLRLGLRLDF